MPDTTSTVICSECAMGMCGNCDGTALDERRNLIVLCDCGHGDDLVPYA